MGRRLKLLVGVVVALAALPSTASAATQLQIGVGRADITPPTGYYMMGGCARTA